MDRLRDMYHPKVVSVPAPDWPEPGPFVGREAIMRQWEQMRATFDGDELEVISDFTDSGDRVAVRLIWRGAGQGPELNMEMTNVLTVRNGRIVGLEYFWDHTKALATMGLEE